MLSLAASILQDYDLRDDNARQVLTALAAEGLITSPRTPLRTRIAGALEYVRRLLTSSTVEPGMSFDPATGTPTGASLKITLNEPSIAARRTGVVSVDDLLRQVNDSLEQAQMTVWVLFDRLDVAFAESRDLEANALRALFKVYLDLLGESRISLKVFLRTDIWRIITSTGFREASHITRDLTISWTQDSLLNLVVQRLMKNTALVELYGVDPRAVLADVNAQREFFERLVPEQVDSGRNPKTFEWLLGRAQDGTKVVAPRELIHLLSQARDVQLRILETGGEEPPGEMILTRQALREALPEVSRVRLEQTLLAEYPEVREYLLALENEKTNQTTGSLRGNMEA